MKAISASIVVLAGAAILIAGNFLSHDMTQLTLSAIGCGVAAVGLLGWISEMKRRD